MTTREKILQATLDNQPPLSPLPDITVFMGRDEDLVQKYMTVFKGIGGNPILVENISDIKSVVSRIMILQNEL